MILDYITITGADDQVDYDTISQLSESFVEWGILMSESRMGTPRYPSTDWIAGLEARFKDDYNVDLSQHLCGGLCDFIVAGGGDLVENRAWQRTQLNTFPDKLYTITEINRLAARLNEWDSSLILPIPNDDVRQFVETYQRDYLDNVCFLFDPSRGTGNRPPQWPDVQRVPEDRYLGFAGGINPDNIRKIIDELCERPSDRGFWLDLESGARDPLTDRFDPERVRKIIDVAGEYC